jgi:hypothetical protein
VFFFSFCDLLREKIFSSAKQHHIHKTITLLVKMSFTSEPSADTQRMNKDDRMKSKVRMFQCMWTSRIIMCQFRSASELEQGLASVANGTLRSAK